MKKLVDILNFLSILIGLGTIFGFMFFLPNRNEAIIKVIFGKKLPTFKFFKDSGKMTSHFKLAVIGVLISLILIVTVQVLEAKH